MDLSCKKCGHEWMTRTKSEPKVCPLCKSKTWMNDGTKPGKSVYVVSFKNGTTKIGISANVETRISQLISEYGSDSEAIYNTERLDVDVAKGIEQQVLFVLRDYMVNGTELMMLDFYSVKQSVLSFSKNNTITITDILSSGDDFLPITPLVRIINGDRRSSGGSPFNIDSWLSCKDNMVFIYEVEKKFGNAIVKKQGGYTYAHKYIFADIGISAGGKAKMEILSYLSGLEQ